MEAPQSDTSLSRRNAEMFVRLLPEVNSGMDYFKVLDDERHIYVRCWQDFAKGKSVPVPNYMLFNTNGVFYNVSQQDVFARIIDEALFQKLIHGNNALILSFGQTGSGKTLTTAGLQSTYEDRGFLPRILEKLFDAKLQLKEKRKISIKMRYVEANRNYMKDLFDEDDAVYDMNNYKNIQPVKVKNLHAGLKMLFKAEARKTVRQSEFYKSNLGNTIVTFSVYTKGHNTPVSEGTLHVVDLAGVDTVGNASCEHKTGYEVGNGNLAKSQIEQFIMVINNNFSKSAELKQRLCILIHYLRHTINAHSIIRAIAHLRVSRENLKVSTSLLRLGCSLKGMAPKKLSRFLETSIGVQFTVVSDELRAIRKEMDLNAMLCDEDMSYNLSDERLAYIKHLAMEYLDGDKSELVLLSTTDTVVVMKVIKAIYQKLLAEGKSSEARLLRGSASIAVDGATTAPSHSARPNDEVRSRLQAKSKRQQSTGSMRAAGKPPGKRSYKDVHSEQSIRSKTASKLSIRRSLRRSMEMSKHAPDAELKLPVEIPSFSAAWTKFKSDESAKYSEIQQNQKIIDAELKEIIDTYNREVLLLEELQNIANRRRNELSHAIMIRDIDTGPQALDDLREFQNVCTELSKEANCSVADQKEKLLTLQAVMKLNMDYRAKLQKELNRQYDEYCMKRYNVLIPAIGEEASKFSEFEIGKVDFPMIDEDQVIINDKGVMILTDELTNEDDLADMNCKNIARFERLQEYMKRESLRVLGRKIRNKNWMLSFHVGPSCAAKLQF